MTNMIIGLVLLLIIGGAVAYIIRAKKKGVKCIGCPDSGSCTGHCNGACEAGSCNGSCHCHEEQ